MNPTLILEICGPLHGARLSYCCEQLNLNMGELRHGYTGAFGGENIEVWFNIDETAIYELGKRMGRLESMNGDLSPKLIAAWEELISFVKEEHILDEKDVNLWMQMYNNI